MTDPLTLPISGRFRNRSKETMPQLLVTREQAADALSMSLRHFQRHVQPHLRLVRSGQRKLVPVAELQRWVEAEARAALPSERV